jgi:hypothetical protein
MLAMCSEAPEFSRQIQSAAQELAGALRGAAAAGLDLECLRDILRTAFTARNQVEAAVTAAIGALDASTQAAAEAGPGRVQSCASWLSDTLRVGPTAAHAQVRLARSLPSTPDAAAAYERGELSYQHVCVVARVVAMASTAGAEGNAAQVEMLMRREAGRRTPRGLLRWGLNLLHQLAPGQPMAAENLRHRRRSLWLVRVLDGGWRIRGYFDPAAGADLEAALNGLLGSRSKGDTRTPDQRRADGLHELVKRVLRTGRPTRRARPRPHFNVITTFWDAHGPFGLSISVPDWNGSLLGHPHAPSARGEPESQTELNGAAAAAAVLTRP